MISYRAARREFLVALGIPASNRDPLAEFSEHFVAVLVGGTLPDSRVEKGYDIVDPDGRKIQVRYLANPEGPWVNEHLVSFNNDLDFYALVLVEALEPTAVICFSRDTLGQVCARLGKRHPHQERTLQLTRVNAKALLSDRAHFALLGVARLAGTRMERLMTPERSAMTDGESSAAATRKELLRSIAHWRHELSGLSEPSTYGVGVTTTAVRLVERLLVLAVAALVPEAPLPPKPTLGQRVGAIEQYGRKHSMVCLGRPRRLVTRTEITVLNRLTQGRNALVHLQNDESFAMTMGRTRLSDVAEMIDIAEAVAQLPLFDELLCREAT